MIRRLLSLGLPIGGLQLVLAGGAAYLAVEHDQGKHEQPHLLCPICWLNKIAPTPESAAATPAAAATPTTSATSATAQE